MGLGGRVRDRVRGLLPVENDEKEVNLYPDP